MKTIIHVNQHNIKANAKGDNLPVVVLKYGLKLMEKLKQNKGGKRVGSGRKKADYKTKTIAFRVRVEWVESIKSMVKSKVAELSQNSR